MSTYDKMVAVLDKDDRRIKPLRMIQRDYEAGKLTKKQAMDLREIVFFALTLANDEAFELLAEDIWNALRD